MNLDKLTEMLDRDENLTDSEKREIYMEHLAELEREEQQERLAQEREEQEEYYAREQEYSERRQGNGDEF